MQVQSKERHFYVVELEALAEECNNFTKTLLAKRTHGLQDDDDGGVTLKESLNSGQQSLYHYCW